MPMRPCQKCLDNNWSFKLIEGWVRATCKNCNYEVEFPARAKGGKKDKVLQAVYESGKLLIDGVFREVEMKTFKNGDIKIMPVRERLF